MFLVDSLITDKYTKQPMKADIHTKDYRPVVFKDLSNGQIFLTKSTAKTDEIIKIDGKEYPLVNVHISSASHPFFTGQEKLVDVEGRVDKFKARAEAAKKAREAVAQKKNKVKKKESPTSQKIG